MSKKWREVSKWTFGDLTPDEELFQAARYNDVDRVKELIEIGANINLIDPILDVTPLMAAAARGHIDTVKLLIDSGADINCINDKGNTALIKTMSDGIYKEKIIIAKLLLDAGADINLKNIYGDTAEFYVSGLSSSNKEDDNNYKEMANLLKEAVERTQMHE